MKYPMQIGCYKPSPNRSLWRYYLYRVYYGLKQYYTKDGKWVDTSFELEYMSYEEAKKVQEEFLKGSAK